jgi:putative transposase
MDAGKEGLASIEVGGPAMAGAKERKRKRAENKTVSMIFFMLHSSLKLATPFSIKNIVVAIIYINGSKRKAKRRLQIAKLHSQIADKRSDFLHKLSTKVVRENQSIVLEDLNVSGMVKNRKLSRAISLQGWREFRVLCEAKTEKFGRKFAVISRWEPTSQVCSDCGFKWGKLDLKVRTVTCIGCGAAHDRDENAAKNINKVGIGHCHDSKRTQRDSKTGSPASFVEASRITVASAR